MPAISRILLPVDLASRCSRPAREAAALARHFNAEVIVLHVAEQWGRPPGLPSSGEPMRELESFANEELGDLKVKRVIVPGNPAEMIVEQARLENCGMIVMRAGGGGPLRRFLPGSVTRKALQDAPCPVWTSVHSEAAEYEAWKPIRRVLCAIDDNPMSAVTLKWAAEFARDFGACLSIVRVIPPLNPVTGGYFRADWWKTFVAEALDEVSATQEAAGVHDADVVVEGGHPADVIVKVAERIGAEVLVIGKHPVHTLLERLVEHAYAIIHESPCPVVSV